MLRSTRQLAERVRAFREQPPVTETHDESLDWLAQVEQPAQQCAEDIRRREEAARTSVDRLSYP